MRSLLLVPLLAVACGAAPETGDAAVDAAGAVVDSGIDAGPVDSLDAGLKAASCASSFGSAFTNAFGRADGVLVAAVPPAWQCPMPNGDHFVLQVRLDGGVQRMVINVQSSFGDPRILSRQIERALPAPAWEEGWHPGLSLDYPSLGLHSDGGWDLLDLEQTSARIYDAVTIGAPISVYATSSGGASAASAHLVHRNGRMNDGAIVIDPQGASPKWLLFHFANQSF